MSEVPDLENPAISYRAHLGVCRLIVSRYYVMATLLWFRQEHQIRVRTFRTLVMMAALSYDRVAMSERILRIDTVKGITGSSTGEVRSRYCQGEAREYRKSFNSHNLARRLAPVYEDWEFCAVTALKVTAN